ncbi:hypothetical protein HDF09_001438 [Edaphobacter lichenicola]|uniref:DUF2768 domain-containing protein n=1 Tax=Tunturiibacter empetritectus TaxID=3069691 RepID=A0A7W8MS33_9BACT|nr:hypothetical protein [Edaphobacter lichenicola]
MGGIPQLIELLSLAVAIFVATLLIAFLIGKLFENKLIRRRIMLGALGIYALAFVAYFGFIAFILSGNLNSN